MKVTTVTITIFHHRIPAGDRRLVDRHITAEKLRIPGVGTQLLRQVMHEGAAEVAVVTEDV